VNGRGLTWNPGQRVQAFTHPAWFFVVSAAYALTGEMYYTAIALSVLVSLIALALAVRCLPETPWSAVPALIALGFSRAFIEFSTSGLENPLSHLLLIAWAGALLRPKRVAFDLLSSAILLNRFDLALLIAPTWLWVMWRRWCAGADRRRLLVHAACAGGPLLLWFAFATFYFGFALPNTAYAKLGVKIALSDRVVQGFFYTLLLVSTDPASALVLVVAVIVAWRSGDAVLRALATVETGQNQLKDPKLAKLYDQIQLITTGPLWSWHRLQAIWKLNTGQFNKLTRGAQGENAPEVEID
jgi:arabinofuranosyltransferase